MTARRLPSRDAALGLLVMCGVLAYSARYCDNSVFTTDSVDYLRDVKRGFRANYFDTQSGGLWGLISVASKHPEARAGMWDYLGRNGDAAADLHFHVPAGFYPNIAVELFHGGDRAQRLMSAAEGGLIALIVFAGLRFAGVALPPALFTAAFVSVSPSMVSTATDVTPHLVFLAAVLIAGFALARHLETGATPPLLVAAGSFAAAAATLELSIVAAAAFLLSAGFWLLRTGWGRARSVWKPVVLVFLTVLFLAWPGGFFRGGYALSYGVFIFQALFRRENYFGSDSPAVTWMRAGQGSAFILVAIAMASAAAIVLLARKRFHPYLQVFGLLAAGFAAQGMLNHFRSPAYACHFIVTAGVLSALCLQRWLDTTSGTARYPVWAAASAGLLLAILGMRGWPALSRQRQRDQRAASARAEQVIAYVKQNLPADAIVVSNKYNGVWQLYMPGLRVEKSAGVENLEPQPWAGLREYPVIADPERLNDEWRERLREKEPQTVGGFEIARFSVQP